MSHNSAGAFVNQVQHAVDEATKFELDLRAALVSPEVLSKYFNDLAYRMSDLIGAFDNLGIESNFFISALAQVFQEGYNAGAPDYAAVCEAVRRYDAAHAPGRTSRDVPDLSPTTELASAVIKLPWRSTIGSASFKSASIDRPPLPPLATKPAPTRLSAFASGRGVSPMSHSVSLPSKSEDTSTNPEPQLSSFTVRNRETRGESRRIDLVEATGVRQERRNGKRGVGVKLKEEGSHLATNEIHLVPARLMEPDEIRSSTRRESSVRAGTPGTVRQWIPPITEASLAYESKLEEERDVDHHEDDVERGNDENYDPSSRGAVDKSKKNIRCKKVKKPIPPPEQRQNYPRPCSRCRLNGLPCFLPIDCKSSRRTCWHCEDAKMKCPFTVNIHMIPAQENQNSYEKSDAQPHEEVEQDDTIAPENSVQDVEEDDHLDKLIESDTKFRDDIMQLTDKIVTLIEGHRAQEQRLVDLIEMRMNTQLECLTATLAQTVESAVKAAMEGHSCNQASNDHRCPEGVVNRLDDGIADFFCYPKNGDTNYIDGHYTPFLPGQCAEGTASSVLAEDAGNCVKNPLMSRQQGHDEHSGLVDCRTTQDDSSKLQGGSVESNSIEAEEDNVQNIAQSLDGMEIMGKDAIVGVEATKSAVAIASDLEVASRVASSHLPAAVRRTGPITICGEETTTSSSPENVLWDNRALSPLSDIPEEDEEECEAASRPLTRNTRSSSKRKTQSARQPPQAKRRKDASPAAKARTSTRR